MSNKFLNPRELVEVCRILAENAGIQVTAVHTAYTLGSDLQILIRDLNHNIINITVDQVTMDLPPEELGAALIKQNPTVFTPKVDPRAEAIDELKRRTNILIDYANVILATAKAIQLEFEALK